MIPPPTQIVTELLCTQYYEFTENDSGRTYFWDVHLAASLTKDTEPFPLPFMLMDCFNSEAAILQLYPAIDREYAMTTDLTAPLLSVILPCGFGAVIDGWHRLWKALKTGAQTVPVIMLTPEEELRCRIAVTERGDPRPNFLPH